MILRIKVHTAISIMLSITTLIAFWIFSKIFGEILIFYLGLLFSFNIFSFFLHLLKPDDKILVFRFRNSIRYIMYLSTAVSIIFVLFVPAYTGSMLDWMKIPIINWLRLLSSIFLTTFSSGYFLLKIIDRKNFISGAESVVISYLLSIYITCFISYFTLLKNNSPSPIAFGAILMINLLFELVHYFANVKSGKGNNISIGLTDLFLIFSLLLTVIASLLIVMYNNFPLTPGDMRDHHGLALDFSNGFPVYGGILITYSGGYLFHLYLSALFTLCGMPSALAEQFLYVFSFMPFLAFYSALKVFFDKISERKLVLTSWLLSILLGFGGLYALHLRFRNPNYDITEILTTTTAKAYDIYMRVLYLPDIVAPAWLIGLPAFFIMLFFLRKRCSNLVKIIIVPSIVCLGYLGHIAEILFFMPILLMYTIFFRRNGEARTASYVILGLFFVALLDLLAPARVYIRTETGTLSLPFIIALSLAVLSSIAESAKDRWSFRFFTSIKKSVIEKLCRGWHYWRWIVVYVYVFSFIIWLKLEPDFNLWQWGGESFTPFFILPLRFGVVGLLAMFTIFFHFKQIICSDALSFFMMLIPLGFILEQIANYYPIYPAYRYATITFIGSCVIAAFGIVNLIEYVGKATIRSIRRETFVSLGLSFLIVSGMLSTGLYYVNASYYSKHGRSISQDALAAIDFIRQNTPADASILTFTKDSANDLRNFAGLNAVQDAQRWSHLLLSTSNPYFINYIFGMSKIKYIYMTQKDTELVKSRNILKTFLEYFPKAFKSGNVTVYEVPYSNYSSSEQALAIFSFSRSLQENSIWIDDSFGEKWEGYRRYGKIKDYEMEVENGIVRLIVTSNQSGNTWVSWVRSDLSLNTTVYSTLSFRYRVDNNFTWFTLQLLDLTNHVFFYVGHLSSLDFTTESFALPKNQTIARIEVIVETTKDAPFGSKACAYLDFIKISAPATVWKEDMFKEGWEFYAKYGNLNNWNAYSDGGTLHMTVASNQSGTVWVSYSYPLNLRTNNSILSFRYKVDNDYTWFTVVLHNATHRFFFYKGHLTDKTFTTKSYLLPDNQIITRIELIVETRNNASPQTIASAQVDCIEVFQQPFSQADVLISLFANCLNQNYTYSYVDDALFKNMDVYLDRYNYILLTSDPVNQVESFLEWVSKGNILIVLNPYGNGFFANLFKIGKHSPLVSIMDIGSGRIFYVNLFSLISDRRESETLYSQFLENFRELLDLKEILARNDVLPVYNSSLGGIHVRGDLEIHTDVLELKTTANLKGLPSPFFNSTSIKFYGKIILTIRNSSLWLLPLESRIEIKPEKYPVEVEISFGNSSNTVMVISDASKCQQFVPSFLKFHATNLLAYARLPSINATGTITFDELDVHAALYVPLAGIVQQKAEIQGNVKFNTSYISNPIILFSYFKAKGMVSNLSETAYHQAIPWWEILTSLHSILFNLAFMLLIAAYMITKKRGWKVCTL